MNPVHLSDKFTLEELLLLRKKIEEDPKSRNNTTGSIWIFHKTAQKKLNAISWAIFHKMKAKLCEKI